MNMCQRPARAALWAATSLIALGALACGGASRSPVAPADSTAASAPSIPGPSGGTAMISGSAIGSSSTSVSVAGTPITSAVSSTGSFSLANVPAGDVQLAFSGPGVAASVTVSQVQPSQNITVVVAVTGGSATIETEIRDGAGEREIEGQIDAVPPTTAAGSFRVAGHSVLTDGSTQFLEGSIPRTFASLKIGQKVHVKGSPSGDGVLASLVRIQEETGLPEDDDHDTGEQQESASIHGTLTSINGTKPNLTLTVGDTTVKTTADTTVKRRGDFQTLDALATGQSLHVIGVRQADHSIIAREIELDDDAPGGAFEIEGPIGGVSGACPSITFGVNGYVIHTGGSTTFENGACSTLKSGTKVTVNGTRNADGTVAATRVKSK